MRPRWQDSRDGEGAGGGRDMQASGGLHPRFAVAGVACEGRPQAAAGHKRPLSRQHPAERSVFRHPAGSRGRAHGRGADPHGHCGQEVQPLVQGHGCPAHRPLRCQRLAAAGDLGGHHLRQGRLRVWRWQAEGQRGDRGYGVRTRLRQGSPRSQELRGHVVVQVWRAGLRGHGQQDRAALQGLPGAPQMEDGRLRLHARVRRGAGQGRGLGGHHQGLEPLCLREPRHVPKACHALLD
mmetsp:Transcript_23765/g.65689  ORF Transcript_23765/g.65689 Transcript_23765/m.65689 type:complete len:237 (+) Transcript_23765:453-1163(+)